MSSTSIDELLRNGDADNLLPLLEQKELEAATARLPNCYVAAHLLCLLVAKDLCEARFLWRRLSPEAKAVPEVAAAWAVARAQWSSKSSEFYAAAAVSWPSPLQPLIEKLIAQTREAALDAVRQGYECISTKRLATMVGVKAEEVSGLCEKLGWRLDGEFVYVSGSTKSKGDSARGFELQTLTKQLVRLQTGS